MSATPTARFVDRGSRAPCNEWVPLLLEVSVPESATSALTVDNVDINAPGIVLEKDHFRATTLSPGETYRVQLSLRAETPTELLLDKFLIGVNDAGRVTRIRPASGLLNFDFSLTEQLAIDVETICAYPSGTRVVVRIAHLGAIALDDFRLAVSPADAVVAGKSEVRFASLSPGQSTTLNLIVSGETVSFEVAGEVRGRHSTGVVARRIDPPVKTRDRFQFLEPRSLAHDDCKVFATDDRLAAESDGVAVLRSGEKYSVRIAPRSSNVATVELRELSNRVSIRQKARPSPNVWRFDLDVQFDSVFCEPESLHYASTEADGKVSAGEIPICLASNRMKRLHLAGLIGFTLMVQGFVAAFRAWNDGVSAIGDILAHPVRFELWKIALIPALWVALWFADFMRYRWLTR